MKTIIFILLMVTLNASAMTLQQAKAKITEINLKDKKTPKDISDFKEALSVISSSWAKQQ